MSIKRSLVSLPIIVVVLLSATLSFSAPENFAFADAGPVHMYGVNIVPYQENSIRLEKENLAIKISKEKSENNVHVYAKFVFLNEGESESVKMGFPFGISRDEGAIPFPPDVVVKVNGKTIKVNRITTETSKYDPWIYFDVSFSKGETKTVEVSYAATSLGGRFVYILDTGSLWKGPIGTLDISIKFPYEAEYPYLLYLKPNGYTLKSNEALYYLTNFEPVQNIEIEFMPVELYNKIKPLKNKAEKTNSAEDWLNYALSFFTKDPLTNYNLGYNSPDTQFHFISGLKHKGFTGVTSYQQFVWNVLNEALAHTRKNDTANKILNTIKTTRSFDTASGNSFEQGINGSYFAEGNKLGRIQYILGEDDIKNPKSKTEGEVITFFLQHKTDYTFSRYNTKEGFKYLTQFLEYAKKYIQPKDINCSFRDSMYNNALIKQGTPFLFQECFVPKIVVKQNKENNALYPEIEFHYILPPQNYIFAAESPYKNKTEFFVRPGETATNENPNKTATKIALYGNNNPPYDLIVSLKLGKVQSEEELKSAISSIQDYINEELSKSLFHQDEMITLLSTYPKFILQGTNFNKAKGITIDSNAVNTSDVKQNALSQLNTLESKISSFKEYAKGTSSELFYINDSIRFLEMNKTAFNEMPDKITVQYGEKNSKTATPFSTKDAVYTGVIIALLLTLIFALLKRKAGKKE